ncbi:hypothetical protein [Lentzea sp. NPDC004782]|uniref:hypothetical protein n=1 Tax=Lentzea sp. NPDC004782 TaxID=3154458 RepID=UPI0033BB6620
MSDRDQRRRHAPASQCSDCGKWSVKGHLEHAPTCPVVRGIDNQMIEDHEWFAARPGLEHRCRVVTSAERMEFGDIVGGSLPVGTIIHVQQLEPGVRTRAVYVPGEEPIESGTVGVFGHPQTFDYLVSQGRPLPATKTAALPNGLEVRVFSLPVDVAASTFATSDVEGVVVVPPGIGMPVPFPAG